VLRSVPSQNLAVLTVCPPPPPPPPSPPPTDRRCADEYTRFKNCIIGKLNPDQQLAVLPGPHFLWKIRTRKEAGAFWKQHYAHLGAAATGGGSSGGSSGGEVVQPVDEAALRPDVTSKG
jgi:hypothetical protein